MSAVHRYWESQSQHGPYDNCICTAKFIAGKMVGLFRAQAKFRDYWRSPLLKGFETFDRLNRRRWTDRAALHGQLDQLIKRFPGTYLAYRAKRMKETGRRYVWSKSGRGNLTGKNGELNNFWFYLRQIDAYNKYVLPDASGNASAGVCAVRRVGEVEARIYNSFSYGAFRKQLKWLGTVPELRATRNLTEANRLLDKQVPLVAAVGWSQNHWLVIVRPKGGRITFIDPLESSASSGVGTSAATRLSPGVKARNGSWGLAASPSFLYYVRMSRPLVYMGR